tara:strand:- start:4197 stop:5036 length:840 start_codon:yes stop_codon:yes gene_type:complete
MNNLFSKKLITILSILILFTFVTISFRSQILQSSDPIPIPTPSTIITNTSSVAILPKPTSTQTPIPLPTVSSIPKRVTSACVYALVNDETKKLLLRADKEMALPDGYEPEVVKLPLEYILQGWTEQYLIPEVANAAMDLIDAAKKEGHDIVIRSSYRSYQEQEWTFAYWVKELGLEQAKRESAVPGHSEHQLGQAIDLTSESVNWELKEEFGSTPEGIWIDQNLHKFGFALSYPRDKEEITGYIYEPWHLRYVGRACSEEWYESGKTLIEVLKGIHLDY